MTKTVNGSTLCSCTHARLAGATPAEEDIPKGHTAMDWAPFARSRRNRLAMNCASTEHGHGRRRSLSLLERYIDDHDYKS